MTPPTRSHHDRHARRTGVCAVAVILFLSSGSAGRAQSEGGDPFRDAGTVNVHAAAGTSNGLRAGVRVHALPSLAGEISVGYLQLKDTRTADDPNPARADAVSFTAGLDAFSHPANDFSGLFSLLVSYDRAVETLGELRPRRWALTAAFGADFQATRTLDLFFRIGPSAHFLSKDEKGLTQLFMHFDAGAGITF